MHHTQEDEVTDAPEAKIGDTVIQSPHNLDTGVVGGKWQELCGVQPDTPFLKNNFLCFSPSRSRVMGPARLVFVCFVVRAGEAVPQGTWKALDIKDFNKMAGTDNLPSRALNLTRRHFKVDVAPFNGLTHSAETLKLRQCQIQHNEETIDLSNEQCITKFAPPTEDGSGLTSMFASDDWRTFWLQQPKRAVCI